jgi:hypothetical protein
MSFHKHIRSEAREPSGDVCLTRGYVRHPVLSHQFEIDKGSRHDILWKLKPVFVETKINVSA